MTLSEYFLCTDGDLNRLLGFLSRKDDGYSQRELAKVKAEITRREKLGRTSLIREFRKINKLSS
jgi:hypothetical protein